MDQRVRDGVLRRMVDKWLKAGVLEEGSLSYPQAGTPQGGVISPLLANIYLHEVLDKWFATVVKPRLYGRSLLIRYADDAVLVFSSEKDARRVLDVLPKRFGKYGLRLHPVKTRLVHFVPPRAEERKVRSKSEPRSFDFLGFTHFWGRSYRGSWVVRRKTARDRFKRVLKRFAQWCRMNRHKPVAWQHRQLVGKLRAHDGYYGLYGNWWSPWRLRYELTRIWMKWLNRRSRRRSLNWARFTLLLRRYPLPAPTWHRPARPAANPCF